MTVESNHTIAIATIATISRQFFNQREAKPKPVTPCLRVFFRDLTKLRDIAEDSDWFVALFAAVVINRSHYFGIGFSTVI